MNIQTKYFGEMVVDDSNIIQFPGGVPGFVEEKEFVLLDFPGNSVFQVLQSFKTENLAFIVTIPYHFYREYSFDLDDSIQESLQIETESDVTVFSIVTLANTFEKSTLNLKAPVIINSKSKLGKQYILNNDDYPSKAKIWPTVASGVKGE
ncbi:flagellar assembly protein FliW [Virgibacillus ndiopensis]|uniref:flagellar assembly protein FliW n=1 Tax=Virgibacillus ndiopensis TaxID=2004408 RepID=UPI000C07BE54|nr:flagellar assembly protein FliW [Virgibacillus ndiopensis]